ncbi:hypothetical protein IL306_010810 [Fusarium sp. DS 682]|nr:hypothetical protein IL306_010810 [Fusarium sp. DS 682]
MSKNDPSMIKRSTFVPWNPANKANTGPEPSRIVSDIIGSAAVKASAVGFLSNNPRIQAAQSEWERKSQVQSLSRPSSTGPVKTQKRDSPSDIPPAKRQNLTESEYAHAREVARRFTEDDVARQLAELESASIKKSAMNPSSQPQPVIGLTGAELMKKYTGLATSSPTPAPPAPTKSPDLLMSDARIEAIIMAEPGRPYTMFPTPNGGISARGALIPANYQLHDDPELPFVCPVRDCRRVFGKLIGLGGHFGAGHCSSTFNDNGDGTLSKVGSYQKDGPGGTPGIIVSRNPLPPDAPPPVDPGLSVFASFQQSRMSRAAEQEKKITRSQDPTYQPRTSIQGSDVKSYLHQHLSPAQMSHHREDIDFMLTLPRRRDLPESWKHTHRGSNLDINHYACAVAYLTGKVVTGSEQCTVHTTRPSARLSQPCIALPPGMPESAKRAFSALETCVGCRYWCHLQRRSNSCDWCPEPKLGRGSDSSRSSSSDINLQIEMDLRRFDAVVDTGIMTDGKPKRKKRRSSGNDSLTMRDQTAVSIISTPGQMGGVELEMEDWEVAPGRMKDESSDNIAFSNSYLTSGQPVTVSEDVSFNVMVLKPGSANHWTVEDDKLRTCSVASGKVRVTMNDKTFNLGPNGMFVVRPGQTCKAENRLYVDSVVHCTTIGDFSLQ